MSSTRKIEVGKLRSMGHVWPSNKFIRPSTNLFGCFLKICILLEKVKKSNYFRICCVIKIFLQNVFLYIGTFSSKFERNEIKFSLDFFLTLLPSVTLKNLKDRYFFELNTIFLHNVNSYWNVLCDITKSCNFL